MAFRQLLWNQAFLSIMGLALLWQAAWGAAVQADVLLLKSGGELRGELQPEPRGSNRNSGESRDRITLRTTTGAVVSIARDEVEEVIRRRPLLEEYETLRRAAADTVDGQWELAKWCRQKSLLKERAACLQRVVELDPDHVAAHRGLGHVRHGRNWTTTEALMKARGYVRYKGRFVLPQELELIEAEVQENAAEKGWFKRIKLWEGWLDSDRPERQAQGLKELEAIRDGNAVAALVRNFKDSPNEQKRLLYVEILTRIEGEKPLTPLVQQSLRDDSRIVRAAAVRGARQKDPAAATEIYLRALKNELNVTVNRAATALGQLGDDNVVPQLIDALVTRHRYKVLVPERSVSFSADGSMSSGGVPLPPDVAAGLATGQYPNGIHVLGDNTTVRTRQITVQKDEQNPSTLAALNALTGEDFGFDEQSWRNWHKARVGGTLKAKPKKKSPS
jgi:HEAT repeats